MNDQYAGTVSTCYSVAFCRFKGFSLRSQSHFSCTTSVLMNQWTKIRRMLFHPMQPLVCMCFCDSAIVLDLHAICIKNKSHCAQSEMVLLTIWLHMQKCYGQQGYRSHVKVCLRVLKSPKEAPGFEKKEWVEWKSQAVWFCCIAFVDLFINCPWVKQCRKKCSLHDPQCNVSTEWHNLRQLIRLHTASFHNTFTVTTGI